jgi:magnesium chelatase family protein
MLAERLNGLLPPLDERDALEVVRIHSARGSFDPEFLHGSRPLRAPHHTASAAAMVGGGGRIPKPGEISLAHRGVLFLDELPEFDRRVLESLRQPLESGAIDLSRAHVRVRYPARFQLVAAMNPCPAGRACTTADCICTPDQRNRYRNRVSGPVLDRIDLRVPVPAVDSGVLFSAPSSRGDSDGMRARIAEARHTQFARAGKLNSVLTAPEVDAYCELDTACRRLVERAMERLALSARGVHRVLKVARTLADLVGAPHIAPTHITEALAFRDVAADY